MSASPSSRDPVEDTHTPYINHGAMDQPWVIGDSPFRLALLAVLVGIAAGLGAVLFRALIALFHNLAFFGVLSFSYNANLHTPPSPAGPWIVLVSMAGALVVAFLVKTFAPEAKGHGVPEVIESIYYRRGVIRPVVAAIKAVASSISIGTGGAIGREGPIIQIGAAFGSALGQWIRMPEWHRLVLVACGAAGGIAATFNTPIGGLLFSIELLLPEISARTLIPVAIATGSATFIGHLFFGIHPSFNIPALALPAAHMTSLTSFAAYALLGIILGAVSALYIRSIYAFEDGFDRLPGNYYTRHVLGMCLVGIIMYLFQHYTGHYYIQGVGYATIQDVLTHTLTNPYLLLLLFAAKLLTTSLTLGSGASGGIFSPSLFIGAVLGAAYAMLTHSLAPGLALDVPSAAVIGMAAVVGSATGAVVTSMVIIFEMTRDYNVIVPLMITASIAYGVRRLMMSGSIYSMKLERRGRYIPESLHTHFYMLRQAGDMIGTPVLQIEPGQEVETLHRYLRRSWRHYARVLPHLLVMRGETIEGVLTAERSGQLMLHGQLTPELVARELSDYIVVSAGTLVVDVLGRLRAAGRDVALVTTNGSLENPNEVQGVLSWGDLVRYNNLPQHLMNHSRPEKKAE